MSRDLVDAANRNLVHGYEVLADHLEDGAVSVFGQVTAASSGLPIPTFNRIVIFEPPDPDDLEAAVSWMADREVPFQVTAGEPALETVAGRAPGMGLEKTGEEPGMALDSLAGVREGDPPVRVTEVTDGAGLEAFVEVSSAVFGFPLALARDLMVDSILEEDDLRFVVGEDDGEAVACGQLVRSSDVAGVYSIAVREDYRRQGIGTAMSRAVLRRGRDAGCTVGVLRASEMGQPVYEGMGFETVTRYHDFQPAE